MTAESSAARFGYYPHNIDVSAAGVTIATLSNLHLAIAEVEAHSTVHRDWIYAGPAPHASRIFGLPRTHEISLTTADGADHLAFHLWALSFFTGMRLTATDAGFVDATPIKRGKLVDFVTLNPKELENAITLVETFWKLHRLEPRRAKRWAAAVHALFLGQSPRALQFETFTWLYTALDACFALAAELKSFQGRKPNHAERIDWMCKEFGMTTPPWADPKVAGRGTEVSNLRNDAMHEALFMDQPLGFAVHGKGGSGGANGNLPLEMEALLCRFLVALLGASSNPYVTSPIHTRQKHGLSIW